MAEIQIVGPIDKNTILDLRGSIVSAFVSPAFGSQPIPLEDFFRFARVLRVEIAARDGEDAPRCPRCEEPDEPLVSQVKPNFINSLRPEQTGE